VNHRTRLLLIAMTAIGVFWAGDAGYRNLIEGPTEKRSNEIELLDKKIKTAHDSIVENDGAMDALDELERMSLPYDPELARARYQDWLLGLVQSVQLTGTSVDAGKPTPVSVKDRDTRKPKEIFLRYTFSLRGRGTLQQVSRFLHHFYQAGHLHKIGSMTMNPITGGRMIDFSASIEALGLTRCERKEELSGESVQRLASSDFSDYQSISRRNLFARHGDDTLSEIVLSAITIASDGTAQAWFAVGDGETQVLKRGETLEIPAHMIEVIDIVAGQVLLDVNGRVVTLMAGESIENKEEEAIEEQAEEREAV
jgi:hypothetical protein